MDLWGNFTFLNCNILKRRLIVSYTGPEINERPDKEEKYLSLLFLVSLVSYLIVIPSLFTERTQEIIYSPQQLRSPATLNADFETTMADQAFASHDDYVTGTDIGKIYCIIVGSYINPDNARAAAERYNQQGYQTNIIGATISDGKKAELVSIRIFGNYDEAVTFLQEIRNRVAPQAWIYCD